MSPTASVEGRGTDGAEVREVYEEQRVPVEHARAPEEASEADTATPVPSGREESAGVKTLRLRPGDLTEIRFPYDYEREQQAELIRRLNEDLGW